MQAWHSSRTWHQVPILLKLQQIPPCIAASCKYQHTLLKCHHNRIGFDGQRLKFPGKEIHYFWHIKYRFCTATCSDENIQDGQPNICTAVSAMFLVWCTIRSADIPDAMHYINSATSNVICMKIIQLFEYQNYYKRKKWNTILFVISSEITHILDSISMRLLLKCMYSKINMTVSLLLITWLIVVQDISNCGID